MRRLLPVAIYCVIALPCLTAATVGSGSPNPSVQSAFITAYQRGQFSQLVSAPTSDVKPLGSPGFAQLFPSKANSAVNYALVVANPAPVDPSTTVAYQVYSDIYAYYSSLAVATVGYPLADTTACPANFQGTCDYQLFSGNYALFVYASPALNVSVADPYYTQWSSGGAVAVFGPAISAPAAVTSVSTVAGSQQLFTSGAVFSYPTGSTAPSTFGVGGAFYAAFNNQAGLSTLGFPTSAPTQVNTAGLIRQTFENGRIEMLPGAAPNVLYNIVSLRIGSPGGTLALAAGATGTLSATAIDYTGTVVTGRALGWSTTNGAVVSVQGNGDTATIHAVAGGTAGIYVTGEGKTSPPLVVTVASTCCTVGQGAPSAAITQAFQTAISRNNVTVSLPAAAPVARLGNGYVQTFAAADGSGTVYAVAEADGSSTAWLIGGTIYTAYTSNGGFPGPLGYPVSDALPGGAQKFASGAALAGSPVRLIPAPIAAKWFQLGGPSGPAASPTADPATFLSSTGTGGVSQAFANGLILAGASGNKAGQVYFSSGLILARYLALGGPAGALGFPQSDVSSSGPVATENFETGYIDLQPGASAAIEHFYPRQPAVSATPAVVAPGGRVHVSATGFAPGATLAFTLTNQPAFTTPAVAGTFQWDILVPPSAKPATVAIQVKAQSGTDAASASYSITPAAAFLPQLTLVSGDRQTGSPGGSLAAPIVAQLLDSSGNPIPGVPVIWTVSPGASIVSPPATDSNGQVSGIFRLPASAGVAVGAVTAAGKTVSFSALAAGGGALPNFPVFTQQSPQGALVASLAAILRYYQNAGTLGSPNGLATPASLSAFLTSNAGFTSSETGSAIANPWVAVRFAGAGLWFEDTGVNHIVDLLSAGTPVVLILNLTADGQPAGSAVVVADGVNADGSMAIADPNPTFGQTVLSGYLNGFTAQGHAVVGTVAAAIRTGPAQGAAGGFVLSSLVSAGATASSPFGFCPALDILDSYGLGTPPGGARFAYCDGSQSAYEVDFATPKGATIIAVASGLPITIPVNTSAAWRITPSPLSAVPLTAGITAVTDAAAFGVRLAPGGIVAIFGSGLAVGAKPPVVTLAGKSAQVLSSFPFQINAVLPQDAPVGAATLQVSNASGPLSQNVQISATAPGIFVIGTQPSPVGAILNQDGSLNSPAAPAQRGQYVSIYCTGLGVTTARGGFQTASQPVSVVVNGTTLTPSFAGLVPGFVGLYQVNVTIPAGSAPGLAGSLVLQQSSVTGNTVPFALQ